MKYVAGFLVLVFVLLWIPVGINRILDEKPNPEIAGFIAQSPVAVPENAVLAYQYWLAIRVPEDQDPAVVGAEYYESARQILAKNITGELPFDRKRFEALPAASSSKQLAVEAYLSKADYLSKEPDIIAALAKTKFIRTRFEKLLELGGPGSSLPPRFELATRNALLYMDLSRDKLLAMRVRLHQGETEEVVADLVKLNRFLTDSLKYPATMMDTMIRVALLDRNRKFAENGSKEYPRLKALLVPHLESFRMQLSFDEIVRTTLWTEYVALESLWGVEDPGLELTDIDQELAEKGALLAYEGRLYQENRTRNAYFEYLRGFLTPECEKNADACPRAETLRERMGGGLLNARGAFYADILGEMLIERWKMLQESHARLSSPLKL